jgi:hypothetical protein
VIPSRLLPSCPRALAYISPHLLPSTGRPPRLQKWGRKLLRQFGAYSIPSELDSVVDFVTGISDFPMPRADAHKRFPAKAAATAATESSGRALSETAMQGMVVPSTLRSLYSVPSKAVDTVKSSLAAIEFDDASSFSMAQLDTFYKLTEMKERTNITHVVGPFVDQPDTESSLDIQYITAMGLDATNWCLADNA